MEGTGLKKQQQSACNTDMLLIRRQQAQQTLKLLDKQSKKNIAAILTVQTAILNAMNAGHVKMYSIYLSTDYVDCIVQTE